jgi:pimeloyl-ACP methyl ester carboxylesterase
MQTGYTKDDLRGLAAPVLFVASSLDPLFPGEDIRAAAGFMAGARVIEIPASGHSTYFEDPGRWNRAVLEFLRGLSR